MSLKEFHMDAHIRLYSMMQRKGFTYDDLSEETGISVGTISNYVNGVTSPTLDRLFLIAKENERTVYTAYRKTVKKKSD